jgi:hypothetical protein
LIIKLEKKELYGKLSTERCPSNDKLISSFHQIKFIEINKVLKTLKASGTI